MEIKLIKEPSRDHISDSEMDLIDAIYQEHGDKDQWQLRDWCHERCGEWTPLEQGRDRITIEKLARALGKSDQQIERLNEEAAELNFLTDVFGR
jgi:hypothetical protein